MVKNCRVWPTKNGWGNNWPFQRCGYAPKKWLPDGSWIVGSAEWTSINPRTMLEPWKHPRTPVEWGNADTPFDLGVLTKSLQFGKPSAWSEMKCYPAILVSHHVFFVLCIWHHMTLARPSKIMRAVHMRISCFQSVSSEAITKELFLLIIQDQSVQLLGTKWWRCWNNACGCSSQENSMWASFWKPAPLCSI